LIETEPKPKAETSSPLEGSPFAEMFESARKAVEAMQSGVMAIGQPFSLDYNQRLEMYYRNYDNYLRDNFAFKELSLRTIVLDLVLVNRGTSPAEDINLFLHFPDGFSVYDEKSLPKPPQEPDIPAKQLNLASTYAAPLIRSPNLNSWYPNPPRQPKIRKTNSYEVEFQYAKLNHGFLINCDRLYVAFDSWESAQSFSLEYIIHAGNMISEHEGKLGVVVNKVEP
jgi:hypothetical protein